MVGIKGHFVKLSRTAKTAFAGFKQFWKRFPPYLLQEKKDLIQQESVLSEIVAKLDPFAYERRGGEEDIYTQDCEQAKQLLEKRIKALGKQGYRHFSIMQPQKSP